MTAIKLSFADITEEFNELEKLSDKQHQQLLGILTNIKIIRQNIGVPPNIEVSN